MSYNCALIFNTWAQLADLYSAPAFNKASVRELCPFKDEKSDS